MAGLGKKGSVVRMSKPVRMYLDGLSKAALVDLVAELAAMREGHTGTDDLTLGQVQELCRPMLKVRGDREPKVEG